MPEIDKQELKHRIRDYLLCKGIDFDTRVNPPVMRCLLPGHEDRHPSAVLYENRLWCPVCNVSLDVFEVAGILIGTNDFKLQIKEVQDVLGLSVPEAVSNKKLIPVKTEDINNIFADKKFDWFLKDKKDCKITGKWFYYNEDGTVDLIDVRIDYILDNNKPKKDIISFYFDGKYVKCKNYPVLIYNRDLIKENQDKPILIVEGPKCAEIANDNLLDRYVPTTWNGGCKKVNKPDWSIINDRTVYIWPDDDRPGVETAIELKSILDKNNKVKILKPFEELRKIKKYGADIEEAFQKYTADVIINYIENSEEPGIDELKNLYNIKDKSSYNDKPTLPEQKQIANYLDNEIDIPFKPLGVADDGKAYFLDRADRLQKFALHSLSKGNLLTLASMPWWVNVSEFCHRSKMSWDDAIDWVIGLSNIIDFKPENIRGRGAWRDDDNIVYHDGRTTTGIIKSGVIYLRKNRKDIGLNDTHLDYKTRREIKEIIFNLSFDTNADAVRCLSWATLAPFGGCLLWRPAILITGPSGSGKTTVANVIIRKIANPIWLDGSESTPAGVRGSVQNDSCSIVFEEAETDTKKKKENRLALFSMMRTNTSDDAPDVAKGTVEGGVRSYKMRNMFCFIAISPEIDSVADENRIFKVNLKKPAQTEWHKLQAKINSIVTDENCQKLRSYIWTVLPKIDNDIKLFIPVIQEITKKDYRYCYAEGLLLSAYFNVWSDTELNQNYINMAVEQFYKWQPASGLRDETDEIIDRLLDEAVPVTGWNDKQTLREIAQKVYTGKETTSSMGTEIETDIDSKIIIKMKQVLHRHGINVNSEGEIAIAYNHHEIMKIIEKGNGYHIQLARHKNCVDKSKFVWMANKTRRCVVIRDLLESDGVIKDVNDAEVPF